MTSTHHLEGVNREIILFSMVFGVLPPGAKYRSGRGMIIFKSPFLQEQSAVLIIQLCGRVRTS